MILNVYPDALRDESGKVIPKDWRFKPEQSLSQAIALVEDLDEPNLIRLTGDNSLNGNITLGINGNSLGAKLKQCNNTTFEGINGATAPAFSVFQNFPNHGNSFRSIEFKIRYGNQAFMFGAGDWTVRDWTWHDCLFDGNSVLTGSAAWGLQVVTQSVGFRIVDCGFYNFREHGSYLHNASEILFEGTVFKDCRRSGTQATNRITNGAASFGTFHIKNCTYKDCGQDGAASVTFAGHTGDVIVEKVDIDTAHKTGGILAYWEGPKPQHGISTGAHRTENGWAFGSFTLVGRSRIKMSGPPFYPVGLDSVGYTAIAPLKFEDTGGKACLELNRLGQGMGEIVLGFDSGADAVWGGNPKARWNGKTMSNEEIDALV